MPEFTNEERKTVRKVGTYVGLPFLIVGSLLDWSSGYRFGGPFAFLACLAGAVYCVMSIRSEAEPDPAPIPIPDPTPTPPPKPPAPKPVVAPPIVAPSFRRKGDKSK